MDVRRLRKILHISQLRLAQLAGVTHRHVQMAEEGLRELSADEELRVLRVLHKAAGSLRLFLSQVFGGRRQQAGEI